MADKGGQGNQQGNNANNNNQIWIRTYIKGWEKSNEKLYAILSFPAKSLVRSADDRCYLLIESCEGRYYFLEIPDSYNYDQICQVDDQINFRLLTPIKDCKTYKKRWIYMVVSCEGNFQLYDFPIDPLESVHVKLRVRTQGTYFTISDIEGITGIRKFLKVR